jgi:HAD superfamily hydrolase (TIGR01490 family)
MDTIAFFDFDGTLTKKDSLIDFIIYTNGYARFLFGLTILSPYLLLYKLGLYNNQRAKEKVLTFFLKDLPKQKFDNLASNYGYKRLPLIINNNTLDKLLWHKNQGHHVVIVTASFKEWIKPWSDKFEVDVISSELEFNDDIITGKIFNKNCYGIEKVNKIKKNYDLNIFKFIYAYGDSKGDEELFSIANSFQKI